MQRVIDISQEGVHLAKLRGFMTITKDRTELGRVAIDEISAVVIHAHGTTYSNSLMITLAESAAIVVLCAKNHFPTAYLISLEGHHAQAGRISNQIEAKRPLKNQLWKKIVAQKILMQGTALSAFNENSARLIMMAREVKSGDKNNVEAQAARHYWPLMMGKGFLRDRTAHDANALLNYGYTILRAAVARAIIAAGLHPSIGVHHHSKVNAFALSDDLIEPFRPLVDCVVCGLIESGVEGVTPDAKRALAKILDFDLNLGTSLSPLRTAVEVLCNSLVQSYEKGKENLVFAKMPDPLQLQSLRHFRG